jgi:hypothetical protein
LRNYISPVSAYESRAQLALDRFRMRRNPMHQEPIPRSRMFEQSTALAQFVLEANRWILVAQRKEHMAQRR